MRVRPAEGGDASAEEQDNRAPECQISAGVGSVSDADRTATSVARAQQQETQKRA